jgi:hypothetical protein
MAEEMEMLRSVIGGLNGWPLDKRDTFAALSLMGLTSRLQPLHLDSAEHQEKIVALAFRLANLAVVESEKK